MQSGIQTRPAALVRGPPYVFRPLTFLFSPSNTENKIRPFIKKLKIGDFADFPFFPMFSSP